MSDATYTVEPDHRGTPHLWRYEDTNPNLPLPVLDSNTADDAVWHAALAVLTPDDAVVELVLRAIDSATAYAQNGRIHTKAEAAANDVLAALRDHATGGDDDG